MTSLVSEIVPSALTVPIEEIRVALLVQVVSVTTSSRGFFRIPGRRETSTSPGNHKMKM